MKLLFMKFHGKHRSRVVTAGVVGLVLGLGLLTKTGFRVALAERPTAAIVLRDSGALDTATFPPPSRGAASVTPSTARPEVRQVLVQAIRDSLHRLQSEPSPEGSRLEMDGLKTQLLKPDSKTEAVEAILGFLRSGEDAGTLLAFRVGPHHVLAEAPTLRTALLDWMGQLDPAAAADYSAQIFEAMTSAEEYAIALRNFARGRPEQRKELRDYFNRLLAHVPWSSPPSAGYLESFDVVPYLAAPEFFDSLSPFLAPSAPNSVRHASLVALDRLVLANPAGAFSELSRNKPLEEQPLVRASFLARADIRDPGQREVVVRYLLSPARSDRELGKFAALFPNANRFVSHNLLTESAGCSLAELAALDAAALEQVRTWQGEGRFSSLQRLLARLERRLQEQVDSALRAGYLPRK